MSDSQVIARKFRPKKFDQVVGQEAITRTLKNAIESSRIHHAYLFAGARGVGKTTTARILARALNCVKGPTTEPCGVCPSCLEIAASSSIDVLEIDAASNTGVDNVRDVIINTASISPARDRYKIFIIDEVHQLSSAAFNALLKTIEEPPSHIIFIMATTELRKVPETILSRCQVFEFRTISLKKVFEQLRRIADDLEVKISDAALLAIARAGEGSMRDAESALDQVISFAGFSISDEDVSTALGLVDIETLNATIHAIAAEDSNRALRVIDEVVARGYDLRNFCRELMSHIRALLVTKIAGFDPELLQLPQGEGEFIVRLAEQFSEQDLVRFFSILTKTEQDIRFSAQPRFQLEMGLIKLVQSRRLYLLEDALKRLADIESRLGGLTANLPGSEPPRAAAPRDSSRQAASLNPRAPQQKSIDSGARYSQSTVASAALSSSAEAEKETRGLNAEAQTTTRSEKPASTGTLNPAQPKTEKIANASKPGASKADVSKPDASKPESAPQAMGEPHEVEQTSPLKDSFNAANAPIDSASAVEKLKATLEARRKMILLSALDKAEQIEIEGEFLRVSFSPDHALFKNQIEGRDNKKVIEAVCREVVGYPITLSATVGAQPKPVAASTQQQEVDRKQQVRDHPAVRALVEKFNGEVIDVIEPES